MLTLCTTCWSEIEDSVTWCPLCGVEADCHSRKHLAILLMYLRGPRPERRERICRILGLRGATGAVPNLIATLKDPDPDVRIAAIRALLAVGAEEAAPALESLACNERHILVRKIANEAVTALKQRDHKHATG